MRRMFSVDNNVGNCLWMTKICMVLTVGATTGHDGLSNISM